MMDDIDLFWYELGICENCVARAALDQLSSGLYMVNVLYLKSDAEDFDIVFDKKDMLFTDKIIAYTFFDGVKRSLDLFKEPIDRMPLLINEKGMTGIIAKYRLEKNV